MISKNYLIIIGLFFNFKGINLESNHKSQIGTCYLTYVFGFGFNSSK